MRSGCTCEGRARIDCPEHGPAENQRRLECAKRELELLMEKRRQGKRLTLAARRQTHAEAWSKRV